MSVQAAYEYVDAKTLVDDAIAGIPGAEETLRKRCAQMDEGNRTLVLSVYNGLRAEARSA